MNSSAFASDLTISSLLRDDLPTNEYFPPVFGRSIVTSYQNCRPGLHSQAKAVKPAANRANIPNHLKHFISALSFLCPRQLSLICSHHICSATYSVKQVCSEVWDLPCLHFPASFSCWASSLHPL